MKKKKEIHSCVHRYFSLSGVSLNDEYVEKDKNRMIGVRNNEMEKMHLILESSRIIPITYSMEFYTYVFGNDVNMYGILLFGLLQSLVY